MNFREAYQLLMQGKKITRLKWRDGHCLCLLKNDDGEHIVAQQLRFNNFHIELDGIKDGLWSTVDEPGKTLSFLDAVDCFNDGKSMRLHHWDRDQFAYYDNNEKAIVMRSYECTYFAPTFDCFMAQDWKEVE